MWLGGHVFWNCVFRRHFSLVTMVSNKIERVTLKKKPHEGDMVFVSHALVASSLHPSTFTLRCHAFLSYFIFPLSASPACLSATEACDWAAETLISIMPWHPSSPCAKIRQTNCVCVCVWLCAHVCWSSAALTCFKRPSIILPALYSLVSQRSTRTNLQPRLGQRQGIYPGSRSPVHHSMHTHIHDIGSSIESTSTWVLNPSPTRIRTWDVHAVRQQLYIH